MANRWHGPPRKRSEEIPPTHGSAEKDGTGVSGLGPSARQGTTHGRTLNPDTGSFTFSPSPPSLQGPLAQTPRLRIKSHCNQRTLADMGALRVRYLWIKASLSQARTDGESKEHTHAHEGPWSIRVSLGCPFHQGTTAKAAARPVVRSPRRSHSHIKLRPYSDRRPRTPPQATADHIRSGACGTAHAHSPGTRADAIFIILIIHIIIIIRINNNIIIRINIIINDRLGGGEPLTQLHSTLLGTPTDAVAGSLLPSFIRLYWAPTDAGGR